MGGGEILKKGWLIKSPPLEGSGMKSWRKRWFCLRSSKVLEYYKGEEGDLKGVVNLEDCKAVNSSLSHKKYKYVFDVETKDRTYYLVAASQEEMASWVEAVCRVCNFSSQSNEAQLVRNAITLPVMNTQSPYGTIQGVAFTEKFKPPTYLASETECLYSLAVAAEHNVQRQLSSEHEVPAGTPLSEALATKGIGSSRPASVSSRTSLSSAGGSDAGLPDSPFLTPHPNDGSGYLASHATNPHSIYSSPHRNKQGAKQRSATLMPGLGEEDPDTGLDRRSLSSVTGIPSYSSSAGVTSASATAIGRGPGTNANGALSSSTGASLLSNGYMRPRPLGNYDYPFPGPPRPVNDTSPSRQHRSALLKEDDDSPPPPVPPYREDEDSFTDNLDHSYINVKSLLVELPPSINRSKKPFPPPIDRSLKPPNRPDSGSDSPGESPPVPKHRVGSIDGAFTETDIPKRTHATTLYTQVELDPTTRRPVPLPRGGGSSGTRGGRRSSRDRVDYTQVDLQATQELQEKRFGMREKKYVNVSRDGRVDDETNPDYYTHMRNFNFDDADKPEFFSHHLMEGEEERSNMEYGDSSNS